MSHARVMVAVPTRGTIGWQTVNRLSEIRDAHPTLPPILWQLGNLSVALTRNRIVKQFMQSPCETLVMVDDDIVPPPHMLDVLVDSGYDLAAIPHAMPHPTDPGKLMLTALEAAGAAYRPAELREGWNDVDAVATGCVALTRSALDALGPNPFRISNDPDDAVTSDDFLLCQDLLAAGRTVGAWWDGWYCDHVTAVALAPLMEASIRNRVR